MTCSADSEAECECKPESNKEIEIEIIDENEIKAQDFEDTIGAGDAPEEEKKTEENKDAEGKNTEGENGLYDTLIASPPGSPVSPVPEPHPPRYDELFVPRATLIPKRHFSPPKAKSRALLPCKHHLQFVPVKLISPMQTRGIRSAK